MTVPIAEASRFGIMNTDEEGRITEFEEKPKVPRSNKASMGIYIFNWSILKSFWQRTSQTRIPPTTSERTSFRQ